MQLNTNPAFVFDFIEKNQIPANGYKQSFTHVLQIDVSYFVVLYYKRATQDVLLLLQTPLTQINTSAVAELLAQEVNNNHLVEDAIMKLEKAIFDSPAGSFYFDAH